MDDMSRVVRYEKQGGPEVLEVVEEHEPVPAEGEVRVRVHSAGLNPVDGKIRAGLVAWATPALPAGTGNDLAGVIDMVGEGVTTWTIGDRVLGAARNRAVAEHVTVASDGLVAVPDGLDLVTAGVLDIAGRTAWNSVASQNVTADDTVLVSGAAGGVGVITAQLARNAGAVIVGTASARNADFLTSLGVVPVEYGPDLVENVRRAAPQGVTIVLDTQGAETVDAAFELGVPAERINSIAHPAGAADRGVREVGGGKSDPAILARLAGMVADGSLVVPIEAVYPLDEVREAYARLEAGHARGKIAISPTGDDAPGARPTSS